VDVAGCDETQEYMHSRDVESLLAQGDCKWETLVPDKVRDLIKSKKLFGFK
jgi:hypothetical protein